MLRNDMTTAGSTEEHMAWQGAAAMGSSVSKGVSQRPPWDAVRHLFCREVTTAANLP